MSWDYVRWELFKDIGYKDIGSGKQESKPEKEWTKSEDDSCSTGSGE